MMKRRVYEIVVREVVTELTEDSAISTMIDCAQHATEADCPWCPVTNWAEELADQDAS